MDRTRTTGGNQDVRPNIATTFDGVACGRRLPCFSFTTRWMADAASIIESPRRSPSSSIAASAAARSRVIAPPRKKIGIQIAEHEVGIGHRRLSAATAVTNRSRVRCRAVRAYLRQPERANAGNGATPAPISMRSITGTRMGMPLPLVKRWMRAASCFPGDQWFRRPSIRPRLRGGTTHVECDDVSFAVI